MSNLLLGVPYEGMERVTYEGELDFMCKDRKDEDERLREYLHDRFDSEYDEIRWLEHLEAEEEDDSLSRLEDREYRREVQG